MADNHMPVKIAIKTGAKAHRKAQGAMAMATSTAARGDDGYPVAHVPYVHTERKPRDLTGAS